MKKVVMNFNEKRNTITMVLKESSEIANCQKGKAVMLNLRNGETYVGIFNGIDKSEDIMLCSLNSGNTIGFKEYWVNNYFEQVGL